MIETNEITWYVLKSHDKKTRISRFLTRTGGWSRSRRLATKFATMREAIEYAFGNLTNDPASEVLPVRVRDILN